MHRIRQTAEDQQCLTPEHVKVGLDSPYICATLTNIKSIQYNIYKRVVLTLCKRLQHFYYIAFYSHFKFFFPFLDLFSSSILSSLSHPSFLRVPFIVASPLLQILFSNIEDILELHKEVLAEVESNLQPEPHPQHALGHVLLQFVSAGYVHLKHTHTHSTQVLCSLS